MLLLRGETMNKLTPPYMFFFFFFFFFFSKTISKFIWMLCYKHILQNNLEYWHGIKLHQEKLEDILEGK